MGDLRYAAKVRQMAKMAGLVVYSGIVAGLVVSKRLIVIIPATDNSL